MSVTNTIIAQNTAVTGPDFAGATTFSTQSLLGNDSDATGFNSGIVDQDLLGTLGLPLNPELGPLQNNGGPTETMALLPGSPAFGAGNAISAGASGLTTDQRGLPRVVNGLIDIGAYQTQSIGVFTVTGATTTENTQSTSGLIIYPSTGATTGFHITGITGGKLYQNNGGVQIANGAYITVAQGEAGLKFTPTTGSLIGGSFTVQESAGGLIGSAITATINVSLAGPSVSDTTTTINTQSTSGLVISRA